MEHPDQTVNVSESVAKVREMFQVLQKYNKKLCQTPLGDLLCQPGRFSDFSRGIDGLLLDFTRVHLDSEALRLLLELAQVSGVDRARNELFRGEHVNFTESRPAMHMAIRRRELGAHLPAADFGAMERSMDRMLELAASLHRGELPSKPGSRVRHIVHVGIGGSLLGTRLLCHVLAPGVASVPEVHFLGSVDAHEREWLLPRLDPAETVVILASKSFSTPDTLMHGNRVREWLADRLGAAANERMFAITSADERAVAMGVPAGNVLYLPDWVGGRYSLWSPVSLAAAARAGPGMFRELLRGAAEVDTHFLRADLADNLPVLMGLLGVWHRNVCGYTSWGVIPYDRRLRLLPAHLQQLIMESTGKTMTIDGIPSAGATAPVVFGECGTDAQHSLFQALHQGSDRVPVSMVGVIRPDHGDREAHAELLANMLAQATALATGRSVEETRAQLETADGETPDELVAHRVFEGNRPTEMLILDDLRPANLGKLLALYEHKVFVESVIWRVNAFDQWGVELGKTLAPGIRGALEHGTDPGGGLQGLLAYIRARA